MKSYIIEGYSGGFRVVSAWAGPAGHARGMRTLRGRELFVSEMGYADRATVLDAQGHYHDQQLSPEVQTAIAAAVVEFNKPEKSQFTRRAAAAKAGAAVRALQKDTGGK